MSFACVCNAISCHFACEFNEICHFPYDCNATSCILFVSAMLHHAILPVNTMLHHVILFVNAMLYHVTLLVSAMKYVTFLMTAMLHHVFCL